MAKLCLLVCLIASTLTALTNGISISTECWLEAQVPNILSMNPTSASTAAAVRSLLADFFGESINQTQPDGMIVTSFSGNAACTGLYAYLSSTPATKPTMDALGANTHAMTPTATSLCALGTSSLAIVNAANVTASQKAEFVAFVEIAHDVIRSNACSIWGIVNAKPALQDALQAVNNGLTCQQLNAFAALTGCYVSVCMTL